MNIDPNLLLSLVSGETKQVVEFFIARGVLKRLKTCTACTNLMGIVPFKSSMDGCAYRCMRTECSRYKGYISIRKGSFFDGIKIKLQQCLHLLYFFCKWRTKTQAISDTGCTKKLVYSFFDALQKRCGEYIAAHPIVLGGDGVQVQIDESTFRYTPKNHRGRMPSNEKWVFGMIEGNLSSNKLIVKVVDDRTASTLLSIIREHVRPLSVIVSDQWAAYNQIERDLGLRHLTVNHKLHFVDPTTGAHTQRIESIWSQLKGKCKEMRGVCGSSLPGYLNEWMWRYNFARNNGQAIFDLIMI